MKKLLAFILTFTAFVALGGVIKETKQGEGIQIWTNPSGTMTQTGYIDPTTGLGGSGIAAKNYLINGNFDLNQRGSATYTSSGYGLDRMYFTISSASLSRETSSPPVGSSAYLRITTTGASPINQFDYVFESNDVDRLKSKIVTWSWVLRRNSTLNQGVVFNIQKNATADTRTGGTWSTISGCEKYVLLADLPSASVWYKFSLTCTIPNDGTANGLKASNIGWINYPTNGSILDVGQMMFNEGPIAAPFQLAGGDIGGEITKAQYYFKPLIPANTAYAMTLCKANTTTTLLCSMYVGQMRSITPSVQDIAGSDVVSLRTWRTTDNSTLLSTTSGIANEYFTGGMLNFNFNVASGTWVTDGLYTANLGTALYINAEL